MHVAPGIGDMDMIVNDGLPPTLDSLGFGSGTAWTDRPVDTFNFKFLEAGGGVDDAIVAFDDALLADTFHTFAIYDTPQDLKVMRLVDDPSGISPGQIRFRWTHTALGIGTLDVIQLNGAIQQAQDLAFGATTIGDFDAGVMTIGIDATDDGIPEWTFEEFDLAAETMVDLWIVNDCAGCTPFLLAYQPNGNTPRRDAVTFPTPGDTSDTGVAPDTSDTAMATDTADTSDTGIAPDTADTSDTGMATDTADTA